MTSLATDTVQAALYCQDPCSHHAVRQDDLAEELLVVPLCKPAHPAWRPHCQHLDTQSESRRGGGVTRNRASARTELPVLVH
jgi:hypothetical protein